MTELQSKYDTLKQKIADAQQEFRDTAKELFREQSEALFEKHPRLEAFAWHQYTPYFNDGDECVFRVSTDYPKIKLTDPTEEEKEAWESGEVWVYSARRALSEGKEISELDRISIDVVDFLEGFEESLMKDMFEDHVEVTVKRDGTVETDSYDHD